MEEKTTFRFRLYLSKVVGGDARRVARAVRRKTALASFNITSRCSLGVAPFVKCLLNFSISK
jgi:hypothetical protein